MCMYVYICKRVLETENYAKKSRFLVTKVEELNDISPGMGASNLALVLKDGKPRNGKINKGFEFGDFEGSSKKVIKFLPHVICFFSGGLNKIQRVPEEPHTRGWYKQMLVYI